MTNQQQQQRRPAASNWRTSIAATLAIIALPLITALDPDCQQPNAPPYTGYSLKIGTDCQQYVYCADGTISSWLTCPFGLAYDGGVGQGGICAWASGVECADTALNTAFDAMTVDGVQQVGDNSVMARIEALENAMMMDQTVATLAQPNANGVENPDDWFCGKSLADAQARCLPCPSKDMTECGDDSSVGCFKGVGACAVASSMNDVFGDSLNGNLESIVQQASQQMQQNQNQQVQNQNQPTPQQSVPVSAPSSATHPPFNPSPNNQLTPKTTIGYYASWQWYDRNKLADPQNIDFTKYSRINYAFFQPDLEGNLYGTDEWADPQLLMGPLLYDTSQQSDSTEFCSWDGPNVKNCAHHDMSKGMIFMAHQAGAEVMPSIGGWTLSDNFPTIAASAGSRNHFAAQCVALIEAYGFDGIDIDWEYPAYEAHSGTPADTVNFTLLLKAVSDALGVLGQSTNRKYGLTAALPCGPDKIDKIQVGEIKKYLTEFNLMSYDMHGAWDTLTGVNAPMYDQGWTDEGERWSTHGCVENYADLGVPLSQMNIGLSFYGRSFQKATGMKQTHGGVDDVNYHLDEGSPQYFNIVKELKGMTTYRHEKTQTQYAVFDGGDRGLVSYDDPRAICDKVDYANERGLHGFLIWEISGDMIDLDNGQMSTPLIDAANTKISNPNFDCSTLKDPGTKDDTYRYAPDEPDEVDWSNYDASLSTGGSGNDFNGAQVGAVPRPAPTGLNEFDTPSNFVFVSDPTVSDASDAEGMDDCPLDFTGYYPCPGCEKYVYCQDGAVVGAALPCSPGTLFDYMMSVCNWAEQVTCGDR